jgi:ATP-dependent DNA helicase RecQ
MIPDLGEYGLNRDALGKKRLVKPLRRRYMGVRDGLGRFGRQRRIRRVAREVFDWRELRPGQGEAMEHVLRGRDVLVVMPTGSGKSAAYQIPGQLLDGPTIVISPLIALQRDQMLSLAERNAGGAVAVNSAQGAGSSVNSLEQIRAGKAEYVFLSPEQLAKPEIVDRLVAARPSLIAIDEAHCVSAWGHDFRPDYLQLGRIIERLGHPPVIALTATASPPVRQDIVAALGLRDVQQVIRGFDRPNISLEVRRFADEPAKRRALVEDAAGRTGLGLVYVATRRDATAYAEELTRAGLRAETYHAGMKASERERVHTLFSDDGLDVVVATSAFGMGIDKPNVRYVLHSAPPESPDSYYQEIGRAGRDGQPSGAVLYYRSEDLGLRRFFAGGKADEDMLRSLATLLHEHNDTVEPRAVRDTLGIGPSKLTSLVNLLQRAEAIEVNERGDLRYTERGPAPEQAVAEAMELDENRRRVDDSRIDMMRGYAETTGCRRRYLLEYFGEPYPQTCGNCGNCVAGAVETTQTDSPFPIRSEVVHAAWGPGTVMRAEADRITVLFEDIGYKTLSLEAVQRDSLLTLAPAATGKPSSLAQRTA